MRVAKVVIYEKSKVMTNKKLKTQSQKSKLRCRSGGAISAGCFWLFFVRSVVSVESTLIRGSSPVF